MNSNHLRRCAIDLNFFLNGTLIYDTTILKPLGDYWVSLDSKNDWGGFWKSFKDVPHFERKV
jgi:peptidoglycan L-alanyl-D-glutamate endopeptidase CwlK